MRVSPDVARLPKKSLGYGFECSSSYLKPVTGQEWVFTATDEQMETLYEVERLMSTMVAERCVYHLQEVHRKDVDGYGITVMEKGTTHYNFRIYEGLPKPSDVLFHCREQYKDLMGDAA